MTLSSSILTSLCCLLLSSNCFSALYSAEKSLADNAEAIALSCSAKDLNEVMKGDCYDSATRAYKRYLKEVALMDDSFLTESIQSEYVDKVVVATHSYTMSPQAAKPGVDYAFSNGASGLYVSLKGHRDDAIPLRKVKGKDWIADATLITQISQGFGEKIILIGFSLGGLLSIQQAKQFPKLVSGYVAMAPSFHGGVYLPHSEKSCFARIGFVRKIAENLSGHDLNDDFILGGCAIFSVSKKISRNIQNKNFAQLRRNSRFESQKSFARKQLKDMNMPGVIIHSEADQVVSHQVSTVMGEILKDVAGDNFLYKKYSSRGPRHWGDHTYFDHSLEVSGFDAIDFVFAKLR
jgi:alpha-beta hydrolase superfamily lysophospholipase